MTMERHAVDNFGALLLKERGADSQRTQAKVLNRMMVCAIASMALHAQAQTSGQPRDEEASARKERPVVTLDAVTVTGVQEGQTTEGSGSYTTRSTGAAIGLPLKLREIPQSISVITTQRMEDQNLTDLDAVLQNTPGITRNYLDSQRVNFSARGVGVDNIQYDGVTSSLDNGIGFIDTVLYDRVEVVRGATGLLTGSGNPSASLNLIRKRPTQDRSFGASVAAGSWNNYRGTVDFSTPFTQDGRIRGRFIGVHQDQKSYLDFYQQKKNIAYGVIEADLTNNTVLTAGYEYQRNQPKGSTWGASPLFYSDGSLTTDLRRSATLSPPWTYYEVESQTAFLNLSHTFANGWKFKSALTNTKLTHDAELYAIAGINPANPRGYIGYYPDRQTGMSSFPVVGVGTKFSGEKRQNTLDVQVNGPFSLFGREHDVILGATLSRAKKSNPASRLTISPYAPYSATPAPSIDEIGNIAHQDFSNSQPWGSASDVRTDTYALYTAARLSLTDDMKLILGGRFNSYDLDEQVAGAAPLKHKENKFTPYAGVTYNLNDNITVFASYTEIFKPQPDMRDRNNNILDPTKGNSREVGIKGEFFGGKLNAALTVFDTRLDKLGQQDTGYFDPSNPFNTAYVAVSGTKTRGAEFEVSGEIQPGWSVSAGYTILNSRKPDGERLNAQEPRKTLKLFTAYRLPAMLNKLTVGGGVNWQSDIQFTGANRPDGKGGIQKNVTVTQGGYALVNLMARYDFSDTLFTTLTVNNALDKRYWMRAGFYDSAAVGAPRSATLTLNYRY